MGFIRSLLQINRQAKEIGKTFDPVQQSRNGVQMMRSMNARLAEQNAAGRLVATGVAATASLTAVRDTGSRINSDPLVELDLLVMAAGRPPYPVTLSSVVPITGMGQLRPGTALAIRVDPQRPEQVAVVWGQTPTG
ncbi:hypothetical protein ACRYCC_23550 [Actinomadura scrupuli]|uniref:hypothetical protein n=1 Tax=Actinomadura scrupuli TaxID=559629 RepID=UPI003D97523D